MSIDPADWLAALATGTLPAAPSPYDAVFVPAPFERRFTALVIDVAIVLVGGGFMALLITMMVWAPLFGGGDFDGPEQLNVLGDWTLSATWVALALLHTVPELFGRPTFGKYLSGLRLLAPPRPVRRRRALRWLLAYLPLAVMTGVLSAGAIRTASVEWDRFDEHGWSPDVRLAVFATALAMPWLVGFLWAAGPRKQSVAERLTGTELIHSLPPVAKHPRGFEVIPTARAART